jgi:type IV pilus assembly protein PilW
MKSNSRRSPSYQAGFTLVELMVGLGIGMLATVIIIQVMSVFEAQRRTTSGTADAQTNGGIALYNITRELQMAGYPLLPVTDSPLECTTLSVNGVADPTTPNRLSPVVITDGVAAAGVSASDTITIRYGDSSKGGVPTQTRQILNAVIAPVVVSVVSDFGCQNGDIAVITSGTDCAMSSASAPAGTVPGAVTLASTPNAAAGVNLACLGNWREITYAVNQATGNLERTSVNNFGVAVITPVVAGIVNLQAQYGIAAAGLANTDANFNHVTQWVNASGATWAAPTIANRNRIKAIRIAVVARNAKIETGVVTAACSSISLAAPTGLCAWDATSAAPATASDAPTIDLSTGDANWARYRYRVFETIIPLRIVVWSRGTL